MGVKLVVRFGSRPSFLSLLKMCSVLCAAVLLVYDSSKADAQNINAFLRSLILILERDYLHPFDVNCQLSIESS